MRCLVVRLYEGHRQFRTERSKRCKSPAKVNRGQCLRAEPAGASLRIYPALRGCSSQQNLGEGSKTRAAEANGRSKLVEPHFRVARCVCSNEKCSGEGGRGKVASSSQGASSQMAHVTSQQAACAPLWPPPENTTVAKRADPSRVGRVCPSGGQSPRRRSIVFSMVCATRCGVPVSPTAKSHISALRAVTCWRASVGAALGWVFTGGPRAEARNAEWKMEAWQFHKVVGPSYQRRPG